MLADEVDYVLGVDTHRDEHVLAVLTAPAGSMRRTTSLPVSERSTDPSAATAIPCGPANVVLAASRCGGTRPVRERGQSRVLVTTAPGLPAT